MDYYKEKQLVATADRKNKITGSVEKWEAHQKGILHKGFTIVLIFKNQYVLQHRKHPAFDGYYDLTISSHPLFIGDKLQSEEEAIYQSLDREMNIIKEDLEAKPRYNGVIWYLAKDPNSEFIEHEMDSIYTATINRLPKHNSTYSYGLSMHTPEEIRDKNSSLFKLLAPWAKELVKEKFI